MCTIRYGYIDVYKRAFHAYLCCLGNCIRPSCKRICKCFAVKSEVLECIVGSKGLVYHRPLVWKLQWVDVQMEVDAS